MRIGVDMVEIDRLRRSFEATRSFGLRVYTASELAFASSLPNHQKFEFLAGRFAVKEAVTKALGTGMTEEVGLTDIESLPLATGAPGLSLIDGALLVAASQGLTDFQVSISHEAGIAIAMVILS